MKRSLHMYVTLVTLVVIGIVIVVACEGPEQLSDKIEFSQFVGTYKANFGTSDLDQIIFRDDSTYVHLFQKKGESLKADSGKYELLSGEEGVWGYAYWVRLSQYLVMDSQHVCRSFSPLNQAGLRVENLSCVVKRIGKEQWIVWCYSSLHFYRKVG